jgi:NAD(P)-dependent dehydrogenase (short-subunit alcohol dehydrogenase family)
VKTIVITGASGGIGLETARGLATGNRIVMVVRSRERGEAAIAEIRKTHPDATIELALADLYSMDQVRKVGAELRGRFQAIDVLINNAGLIHGSRELTVDGFEKTFALNHLAAFLLTYELRDAITSRVITVSSGGHKFARFDWDDLATMNHWKGQTFVYGTSKLCNIWFAKEAAKRFAAKGVTSNALHPGAVASNFGQSGGWLFQYGTKLVRPFLLTSEEGARTSVYLATSPDVEKVTGEYFIKCKIATPSERARNADDARRLWELSERLCGISWS